MFKKIFYHSGKYFIALCPIEINTTSYLSVFTSADLKKYAKRQNDS